MRVDLLPGNPLKFESFRILCISKRTHSLYKVLIMRFEFILLVLLVGVCSASSSSNYFVSKWSTLEAAIKSRFHTVFDQNLADYLNAFLNQTFESQISAQCKDSLIELVDSLRDMDLWAVKSECFVILLSSN